MAFVVGFALTAASANRAVARAWPPKQGRILSPAAVSVMVLWLGALFVLAVQPQWVLLGHVARPGGETVDWRWVFTLGCDNCVRLAIATLLSTVLAIVIGWRTAPRASETEQRTTLLAHAASRVEQGILALLREASRLVRLLDSSIRAYGGAVWMILAAAVVILWLGGN